MPHTLKASNARTHAHAHAHAHVCLHSYIQRNSCLQQKFPAISFHSFHNNARPPPFSSFRSMRLSLVFLVVFCLYVGKCSSIIPVPTPSPTFYNSCKGNIYPQTNQIETTNYNMFQILILASGYFGLLCLSLLQLCNHVKYVTFDTNLCTRRKVTTVTLSDCFWSYSSLIMLGLLLCECADYPLIMIIISINSIYGSLVNLILKFSKITSRTLFSILSIYIYSKAFTPATYILSLMVFQMWCYHKKCPTLATNHSHLIVK